MVRIKIVLSNSLILKIKITTMKAKIVIFLFFLSLISFNNFAQKGYQLSVEKQVVNKLDSSVFVLEVDRALEKDVLKSWEKNVEKSKAKAVVEGNSLSIIGTVIPRIINKPTDVYSVIKKSDGGVKLYTVFIIDSVRVDPNGTDETVEKVREALSDFGEKLYRDVLSRELSDKEEVLANLTKDREKKLKAQDKLVKSVQKDSLNIGKSMTELALLKEQLESANTAYSSKKSTIASTNYSDKDEAKTAKGELKDLDKNRKGIEKEIQKHTDSILDSKADIRDYLYELVELKESLTGVDGSILEQKKMVKEAQEELRVYPN